MLSVKDSIVFEWKTISLPIHREEELDFALHHVSYYDSPFSSSYEERKAYYGEDWYHYTGETLETLCTLPDSFTTEQKLALLHDYRSKIEYGNSVLDKLEQLQVPIPTILTHFLCISLEQAENQLKLFHYTKEVLDLHDCTEVQRRLILYCYKTRNKEKETQEVNCFLQSLQDTYGSDILTLTIQRYKVEECFHLLKKKIDTLPALKDRL
jgi:hypothetical protein